MLYFLVPRSVYRPRTGISNGRRYLSVHRRRSQRQPTQLKSPIVTDVAARTFADIAEEDEDSMEGLDELDGFGGLDEADIARRQAEHNRWLAGEGAQYRRPKENGPNWLGGNIPFPMNPSFRPPVPISNETRMQIYREFVKGKTEQEVANKYGLGISRVKAILRLKKLEELWIQEGHPCQHRFQSEMERYLGVRGEEKGRDRANNIDMNVDAFPIGQSRRLQRVFFEVTEEGQPAPLASHLDQIEATLEQEAQNTAKGRQTHSKDSFVLVPASTQYANGRKPRPATKFSWYYSSKPGRPPYTFVDVGDRYLNHGKKTVNPASLSSPSTSTSIPNPVAARMAEEEKVKKQKEEVRAKRLAAQKALARKALALRRPLLVKEREELERIFTAETKIADARQKLLEKQKRAAELQKDIEKSTANLKSLRI